MRGNAVAVFTALPPNIVGLGYLGLNRLRGKLPSSLFEAAQDSLDDLLVRNTRQVERTIYEEVATRHIRYELKGLGRTAAFFATKVGKNTLDFGIGLVVDVGWQGIADYPLWDQGQITGGQYAGRLGVAAMGSGASWGLGVLAGWGVATLFAPEAVVVAGTVFVVGVTANVAYDIILAPRFHDWFGLSTEEERKQREY